MAFPKSQKPKGKMDKDQKKSGKGKPKGNPFANAAKMGK